MKVTVRCFASVRELLGADVLEVELPSGATLETLKAELSTRAPDFARLPLAQAINRAYAEPDQPLAEGDEVAFIPPISGGDGRGGDGREADASLGFSFTTACIDPRPMEAEARTDRDGAIVTFVGVTRNHHEGSNVKGLSYEAYEEMASEVMLKLLADTRARFDIGRIRAVHRLGDVPIGEASIVVVIAAEHRGPAFEASCHVMDRLKKEVPIFKKEWLEGPDGESRWVGDLPEGSGGKP